MLTGRILLAILFFFILNSPASAESTAAIPEQLIPWKQWVLHGYEKEISCTPAMNNSAELRCDWPTELLVDLHNTGGSFSQSWIIQHDSWISLPGSQNNWPENVFVNKNPALVIGRNGVPQVKLSPGNYTLTGEFKWPSLPEHIQLPAQTGLVSVVLNNTQVDFPNVDVQGRLWMGSKKEQAVKIENRLSLQVYRFIDDKIPLKTDTHIQLEVSGVPREIMLGPIFPMDQMVPVSLNSSLPARLEKDGRIKVQVRPGKWNLTLTTRHVGPVTSLQFIQPEDGFWPGEEIWIFNANPNLRVVEVEGVPAIDPMQTTLPQHWHKYPIYRTLAGDTMRFKEIKRGDPIPAPDQLRLNRSLWLRFDGSGYTMQDTITGTKNTNWRLEMSPPIQLGRVTVDSQEQFITRQEQSDKSGIELRKGVLNLVADSEYFGKISSVPATGWDHDFQQVRANLFLPPGWRLVSTTGIDNVHGTWVKRWSLLDFFIVLILTIAIARLFSIPMAALAFISLVLMYHEPNAPRWIWLAILVCVALLKYLPEGKFKKSITGLQAVNIVILIIIAIPFSIDQLRIGIFPQLEKPWQSMSVASAPPHQAPHDTLYEDEAVQSNIPVETDSFKGISGALEKRRKTAPSKRVQESVGRYQYSSAKQQVAQYDPAMVNQTGPGLPSWQWNSIPFTWSGPVQRDQQLSLFLIGPGTNLVLSFIRVILMAFLALGILNIQFRDSNGKWAPGFKALFLIPVLLVTFSSPSLVRADEIPSPKLFEELRTRLLEKDDCFPECADMSSLNIHVTPDTLTLKARVAAQTSVSIPLPGNAQHWLPQEVTIDDTRAKALFRTNNQLWLLVEPGEHTIELHGKIPKQNSLQLALPLKPHHVKSSAEGWTVEGIHENGKADNQIQFKRIVTKESVSNQILDTGILPPFLLVERTLQLGLTWKITTVIRRISPTGSAVVFEYPLLPGESIITEGIRAKNNSAQVTLDPQQHVQQWESVLEKSDAIHLMHAETKLWTEMWRVDISPIFHMETSGIPVILHQEGTRWYPTWHPWPGEEVTLAITRPTGVEGQTLTIDKVHLENKPGRRATNTLLTLQVRSSQGGQHTITLPENAQLLEVKINGRVLPIRQKQNKLTLPISPGKQEIKVQWTEAMGITSFYRTPKIDLGVNSVNCSIDVKLPTNRWPLFLGGPLMGPAVLFWSVVIIIILVAFALGKTGLTPLKFYQWLLLGIGMSQSNIVAALLVVGWLIALELRNRVKPDMDKTTFNLMQIGIAALTIIAIGSLIAAISQGLLGHPDMNIVGNRSNSGLLKWYQDHSTNLIPQAWILSIPMLFYRLAMLAWALWISFSLINLLKWGWNNYTEPVIWHKIPRKKKQMKKKKSEKEKKPDASSD